MWTIKHLVSPVDRRIYGLTGGRLLSTGRPLDPVLLTTTGRRTGKEHSTPVFYLRDGQRLVVCNVNPGFERPNPWTLNLRADLASIPDSLRPKRTTQPLRARTLLQ